MARDDSALEEVLRQNACDSHKSQELLDLYISDFALYKHRVEVGVYWLKFFWEYVDGSGIINSVTESDISKVTSIYDNFSFSSYARIKEIMKETKKFGIQACALFIAEKLEECGLGRLKSYVYIGITQADIDSICFAKMMGNAIKKVWVPVANDLLNDIFQTAKAYANTPILAMYTGRPYIPTTFSKELIYYAHRFKRVLERIENIHPYAQLSGIGGNHIGLTLAFPDEDWQSLSRLFVEHILNLDFNAVSSQEKDLDYVCYIGDNIRLFGNVLKSFSQYMLGVVRTYGKVDKSNYSYACLPTAVLQQNETFIILSEQLALFSRQRSFDEDVLVANLHWSILGSIKNIPSVQRFLKQLVLDQERIDATFDSTPEVLVDILSTVLQKYGYSFDFYKLKSICFSKEEFTDFVNSLKDLKETDRTMLLNLTAKQCASLAEKVLDVS